MITARDMFYRDIAPHLTDDWQPLAALAERAGRSCQYAAYALAYAVPHDLVDYEVVPVKMKNGRNKLRYRYRRISAKGAA
jgi:hypothetical protein